MGASFSCAGVLFDLDGVLVDSTAVIERQWRKWANRHGLEPREVLGNIHGRRTVETIRLVAPHLSAEAEATEIEEREAADCDGLFLFEGASDLLRSIPRARWAVVTSGSRRLATARLQAAHLPAPEVLVSGDDVRHGKPHPEAYVEGAARLGLRPQQCVAVEDTPAGIRAAHGAGARVVAVTTTHSESDLASADVCVDQLALLTVREDGDHLLLELPGW